MRLRRAKCREKLFFHVFCSEPASIGVGLDARYERGRCRCRYRYHYHGCCRSWVKWKRLMLTWLDICDMPLYADESFVGHIPVGDSGADYVSNVQQNFKLHFNPPSRKSERWGRGEASISVRLSLNPTVSHSYVLTPSQSCISQILRISHESSPCPYNDLYQQV